MKKDRTLPARTDRRATLACLAIAAGAGLAWVIASPPIGVWPLGWIALAPTLWLVEHAATPRRAALYAWTSGAVASLVGFRWFATLLTDQAHLPFVLGALGVALLAAYHGLVFFFMARAIRALRKRGWPMAVCAPLALVTFEKIVPEVFPYFMAITQAPVPIAIQIADLTGPYGVSALLAVASGAVLDGLARRRRVPIYAAGAIAIAFGYGALRLHQLDAARADAPHAKIGLVSSGVPARADRVSTRSELLAQLTALQQATASAEKDGAELVVWSEASYPTVLPHELRADYLDGSTASEWRIRRGFTVPVVIGALTVGREVGRPPWNSALMLDGDGTITGRHDKVHRVLGSEYDPILEWWPRAASWLPTGAGALAAGDEPVLLHAVVHGVTVHMGVMICFEDILPIASRQLGALEPNLLVNMTEDSWFGPDEPYQHQGLAVFRAVEVRSDLVRAVNLGPSSHIDAAGRVVETGAIGDGPKILVVDVALVDGGHTVYCAIGDVFAWLCVVPTLALWLVPWLRKRSWWRPGHAHSGESGPKRKSIRRRR